MLNRAEAVARARELAAAGTILILKNPQRDLENLGYDADDVCDCLQDLGVEDVERELEDEYRNDCCVLVFRKVEYAGDDLYVKVSVPDSADGTLVILSFKLWGSPR